MSNTKRRKINTDSDDDEWIRVIEEEPVLKDAYVLCIGPVIDLVFQFLQDEDRLWEYLFNYAKWYQDCGLPVNDILIPFGLMKGLLDRRWKQKVQQRAQIIANDPWPNASMRIMLGYKEALKLRLPRIVARSWAHLHVMQNDYEERTYYRRATDYNRGGNGWAMKAFFPAPRTEEGEKEFEELVSEAARLIGVWIRQAYFQPSNAFVGVGGLFKRIHFLAGVDGEYNGFSSRDRANRMIPWSNDETPVYNYVVERSIFYKGFDLRLGKSSLKRESMKFLECCCLPSLNEGMKLLYVKLRNQHEVRGDVRTSSVFIKAVDEEIYKQCIQGNIGDPDQVQWEEGVIAAVLAGTTVEKAIEVRKQRDQRAEDRMFLKTEIDRMMAERPGRGIDMQELYDTYITASACGGIMTFKQLKNCAGRIVKNIKQEQAEQRKRRQLAKKWVFSSKVPLTEEEAARKKQEDIDNYAVRGMLPNWAGTDLGWRGVSVGSFGMAGPGRQMDIVNLLSDEEEESN